MKTYRYPGIQPFNADQRSIFFGRDKAIKELYQLITLEQVVVLHSKSGYGKSSLLRAGVLPKFEDEGKFHIMTSRFGANTKNKAEKPVDTIIRFLKEDGAQPSRLDNILWQEHSLWYHLKGHQMNCGERSGYLLIFDQFEELETYNEADLLAFKQQLAEMLQTSIPQRFRDEIEERIRENPNFVADHNLEDFFKPFQVKIVMAIRSDKFSFLNKLSDYIKNILSNCYELDALHFNEAVDAIRKPARIESPEFLSPTFEYEEEAVEEILNHLTKGDTKKIESFQLQIICQFIERNKVIAQNDRNISAKDLGNLDLIIKNYYTDQIASIPDSDRQLAARKLIEEGLIFPEEKRRLGLYEVQIINNFGVGQDLLDLLVNCRLLRREPSPLGGFTYELSHDSLVDPILEAKEARQKQEKKLQFEREQEQQKEELEAARKQAAKEIRRRRILQVWFIATLLTLIGSVVFFLKYRKSEKAKIELLTETEKQSLLREAADREALSSRLASYSLLESKLDRNNALHLALAARNANPENAMAKVVVNEMLIGASTFPFYEKVLAEQEGYINELEQSPVNGYLAACWQDTVAIWNAAGEQQSKFKVTGGDIYNLAFSPTEKLLATGGRKGDVILWDFAGNQKKAMNAGKLVTSVKFASDGQTLVIGTAGTGRNAMLWNIRSSAISDVSFGQEDVNDVAISTNRTYCAFGADDRTLLIRQLPANDTSLFLKTMPAEVSCVAFSADDKIVAAGLNDGSIRFLSVTGEELLSFKAHSSNVSRLVFSADGNRLLSASWDKSAKLWDLQGNLLKTFLGHYDGVRAATFTDNGKAIFTGSEDGTIKKWPLKDYSLRKLEGHTAAVISLALHPESKSLISGDEEGGINVWNLNNGRLLSKLEKTAISSDALAFSPSGSQVALGLDDGTVQIYSFDGTRLNAGRKRSFGGTIVKVKYNAGNPNELLVGLRYRKVFVWDLSSDRAKELDLVPARIFDMDVSNDGELIAVAAADNVAKVFTRDGTAVASLEGHTDIVRAVAISPDKKRIATGSWDNSVRLWDAAGKELHRFNGHTSDIIDLVFSPDGKYVISGSSDNTARIWSIETKEEMPSLMSHSGSILVLRMSNDGKSVVTGSRDKSVKVWAFDPNLKEIDKLIAPPSQELAKKYGLELTDISPDEE